MKALKSVLVTVPGDLSISADFIGALDKLARNSNVVICVGGGTRLVTGLQALGKQAGRTFSHGAIVLTAADWELIQDVLGQNKKALEQVLLSNVIVATVITPIIDVGGVLCYLKQDQFVQMVQFSFDEVYVATTLDQLEQRKSDFAQLPIKKIQVIGF